MPPSVVVMTAGTELEVVPTATQSEVDAQEIAFREAIPVGTVWLVQLVPPSVVVMIAGEGVEIEVVPTATQFEVDAHEIATKFEKPLAPLAGTVWLVQLVPPSVVVITAALP